MLKDATNDLQGTLVLGAGLLARRPCDQSLEPGSRGGVQARRLRQRNPDGVCWLPRLRAIPIASSAARTSR